MGRGNLDLIFGKSGRSPVSKIGMHPENETRKQGTVLEGEN
jgi:hypothetical protein